MYKNDEKTIQKQYKIIKSYCDQIKDCNNCRLYNNITRFCEFMSLPAHYATHHYKRNNKNNIENKIIQILENNKNNCATMLAVDRCGSCIYNSNNACSIHKQLILLPIYKSRGERNE